MKASVNTDGQNNSKNINEGVSMSFSSSSSSFSNQILSLYLDRKKEGSTPKASNRKKQSRTRTTRSSNNSSTVKASNRKSVNSNAEGKELTTTTTTTGRQTEPQKETQTQTQGRRRRKELRMSKIVYRVVSNMLTSGVPRPKSLGIGTIPYIDQAFSNVRYYLSLQDGKDGKSATNGKSGRFGFDLSSVHQDGENGTNAGTASSGQHAGTLTIDLVSAKRASDGELVAKICANGYYTAKCSKAKQEQSKVACDQEAKCVEAEFNTVKVYDSKQKKDRFVVPLAEFQGVDWSARGGNGGNGGIGMKNLMKHLYSVLSCLIGECYSILFGTRNKSQVAMAARGVRENREPPLRVTLLELVAAQEARAATLDVDQMVKRQNCFITS